MTQKKQEASSSKKPQYSMFSNVWFMIKLAWTSGEKKVLALSLITALLAVCLNMINLYISPAILSALEQHLSFGKLIGTITLFSAALMVVSAASTYVKANTMFGRLSVRLEVTNMLNHKAATTSYPNLHNDIFDKILTKALECIGNDDSPGEAIWDTLTNLITNGLGFIIYIQLLNRIQPVLIFVILITTAASYYVTYRTNGYAYRHRDEEAEYVRQIRYLCSNGQIPEGTKDMYIFGLRSWLEDLYRKSLAAYRAFQHKAESVYIWGRIADVVAAFLRNGIAYWYLIDLVLGQELSIAQFLLVFTAVGGFSQWVTGILQELSKLHQQSLSIATVRECLDFPEPFQLTGGQPISPAQSYRIDLESVSFRYPGADAYTLQDINLTLHPNENLAVVGLNGAGKTTLIKLICGFLDPTEGRVLLNGTDIRTFNRKEYYTLFSAVFQNFSVLADTVAVNVSQSHDEIDLERVKACVFKAGLSEKIDSLPQGYQTNLNRKIYEDAVELSGGETQRLMLARALYKDAPFIILDEPTAALDSIAEADIYQKYHEMTQGKTSVYISHRLASTRFCDRIILIDQGKIAEEGTHDQLILAGGRYASLYKVQSKYYNEGDDCHENP